MNNSFENVKEEENNDNLPKKVVLNKTKGNLSQLLVLAAGLAIATEMPGMNIPFGNSFISKTKPIKDFEESKRLLEQAEKKRERKRKKNLSLLPK